MGSQWYGRALAYSVLIAGLGVSVSVHADGAATAELSDLQFHVMDLDPFDGIDATYTFSGLSAGHVYASVADSHTGPDDVQFSQGAVSLYADAGIANGKAVAEASASASPQGLFASAYAVGDKYQYASSEASLGNPTIDRYILVGIDLAPRSMLSISMLGSVFASGDGLARCPNVSNDASMFCESQGGVGTVSASLKYSYQSGFLKVSSDQFDMVSKGVSLNPIYDFPPEDEGFYLQIVDPAPDESVQESRRMYFTFSNTSSVVQHAELRLNVRAGAAGGIPAVPEPSTLACLVGGLAALGWRHRATRAGRANLT